ncbi:MAG: hypothetical protein KAJ51_09080, partial [Thermoplasmata archaeon]|nr:hypothetical protein [Thermoplasmata archaeon]
IADYEILNEHRKRVYFWSYNRFVLPVVTNVIFPVGKTVALLNDTWDSNYTEGNYSIRAWIPLEPRLYSEYHGFQIHSKLTINLSTNKLIYGPNESVNISINVTYTGQEDKTLEFGSTQIADFEVLDEHGERVYLWSFGKGFFDVITEIMLSAGGTAEFLNDTWDQRDNNGTSAPPGNYTIIGWTNDNKLKLPSNPVPIQIKSEPSPAPPPDAQPNLTLTLETDKTTYGVNEEIIVTFKVTNNEAENVTQNFSDGLFANFEILNQNGKRVYLLSTDEEYRIDYKSTNVTISPGETEMLFISNSTLLYSLFPRGNYSIKGWLLTKSRIYSNLVMIEISWEVIVTLKTDRTTYFVNDNITVNISISNIGKTNVTFVNLVKGADFEFINENGNQFWSRQYVDADIIREYTIPPGTSLDNYINDTFIANLPEGYTTIKCWTWGLPRVESNEVTITILDPNAQYGASDPDRDLLTNSEEYLLNTDPQNPDTDDDGLTDGSEITFYGTDPLIRDTDGDGYSDGMEVDQDTDPLNSDEYPYKVDESTTAPNYLLFAVIGVTIVIILILLAVSLNMKWQKK